MAGGAVHPSVLSPLSPYWRLGCGLSSTPLSQIGEPSLCTRPCWSHAREGRPCSPAVGKDMCLVSQAFSGRFWVGLLYYHPPSLSASLWLRSLCPLPGEPWREFLWFRNLFVQETAGRPGTVENAHGTRLSCLWKVLENRAASCAEQNWAAFEVALAHVGTQTV